MPQARALYQKVYLARARVLGPDVAETLRTSCALGNVLLELKAFGEALKQLAETASRASRVLGAEHPLTLQAEHGRARALCGLGRHSEAASLMRLVHDTRISALGAQHEDTLSIASDFGELLGQRIDTQVEGHALLLSVLSSQQLTLGPSHRLTVRTRSRLEALEAAIAAGGSISAAHNDFARSDGSERLAMLLYLFVAPAWRGRGAGRAALGALVNRAWASGATAIEAVLPRRDVRGCALLDSAGFRPTGERVFLGGICHAQYRLTSGSAETKAEAELSGACVSAACPGTSRLSVMSASNLAGSSAFARTEPS